MNHWHEIRLEPAIIVHHTIQCRDGIVWPQDDGVQLMRKSLQFCEVRWRGAEHEIEVQRRHRRSLDGRGGVANQDRLQPHIDQMRQKLASVLQLDLSQVGMTATSGEGLTDFGCGDGLQCFAIITTVQIGELP